jgi:hypothetical protein
MNPYSCENFKSHTNVRCFIMVSKQKLVNSITFPPFLGWSGTESTITETTTGLLNQPWMMMDDDKCEAIGRMRGRGNQSNQRKPAPVPLRPPQISHDLTRALIPCTLQNVY